jgi:hypothetical protein
MSAASKRQARRASGSARDGARAKDGSPAAPDDTDVAAAGRGSGRGPVRTPVRAAAAPAAARRLVVIDTGPRATSAAHTDAPDSFGHLPARHAQGSPRASVALRTSPAVIAGGVFAVCGVLAAATVQHTLSSFAQEGGVSPFVFLAVPGLFAALFAIVVYQGARKRVTAMAQSFSRSLLVALLTWASFSALATSVWCLPQDYLRCYGSFLIVSGLIGGGPMLLAAGVAGAIMGWVILRGR